MWGQKQRLAGRNKCCLLETLLRIACSFSKIVKVQSLKTVNWKKKKKKSKQRRMEKPPLFHCLLLQQNGHTIIKWKKREKTKEVTSLNAQHWMSCPAGKTVPWIRYEISDCQPGNVALEACGTISGLHNDWGHWNAKHPVATYGTQKPTVMCYASYHDDNSIAKKKKQNSH